MSDIEQAIEYLDNLSKRASVRNCAHIGAAITALQEMLARDSGCEHCRERKPILNELGDLQIDDTDSTLWFIHQAAADDIYEDHAAIRWCPMCGRKVGSGE